MTKMLKFKSRFLTCLNETIQKLSLNDEINVVKAPIMEADGNFTSIVKASDTFDPTNVNTNILIDDENKETDKNLVDKEKLTTQAVDIIKQTLSITDELQSVLNQIKKINDDTDYNEWKVNEKGNTATLKNKNAQIFKQNDNLCLSYNNKVEIFKSVEELHDWLKQHNFPLPKNIKIKESTMKESAWDKILSKTTNDGQKIGDKVIINYDELEDERKKKNKTSIKMGSTAYKNAMRFLDKKDEPQRNIKGLPTNEANMDFWYLEYLDENNNESLYLNNNWINGNLLTNNLSQAATFLSREEAISELNNVYLVNNTEAPFKPIQNNNINECFGTTTASLGSSVQYQGDKKESNLQEVDGFPETPFSKKRYRDKYGRASDYLQWLYTKNDNGEYNVDPNADTNMPQALDDFKQYRVNDGGPKAWKKEFNGITFGNDGLPIPMDKEKFIAKVKELNDKYELEIDPNQPVFTKYDKDAKKDLYNIRKLSKDTNINNLQRNKYSQKWWENELERYSQGRSRGEIKPNIYRDVLDREKEYKNYLSTNNPETSLSISKDINELINLNNNTDISFDKFVDNVNNRRKKYTNEDYAKLVDNVIKLYDDGKIDLDDSAIRLLKLSKKYDISDITESKSFENRFINLLNKDKVEDITLTEDETPADFASGQSNTPETKIDVNKTSSEAPTDIDIPSDIDSDIEGGNDIPEAEFGDLNVNLGDYSPEGDDEESENLPTPNVPEYRIIDVLVNDNDESDIKVKLQNLETNEIETKNLYEIDI